jgi:site-specific recombinase XerD
MQKNDNSTEGSIFKVKESNYEVQLVNDNEMEAVLNVLTKRRDRLLYKTIYLTGCRIQEALDLEIEKVPIPNSSRKVDVFENIKSKGKYRNLYAPMSLIEELDDFIFTERNLIDTDHSYIFVSEQPQWYGKQLTYRAAYDKLKEVQEKVSIRPFNFHDLRHTLCSYLIKSGMDISIVKNIMGHECISTTQKYVHLDKSFIEESLNRYWEKSSLLGVLDEK